MLRYSKGAEFHPESFANMIAGVSGNVLHLVVTSCILSGEIFSVGHLRTRAFGVDREPVWSHPDPTIALPESRISLWLSRRRVISSQLTRFIISTLRDNTRSMFAPIHWRGPSEDTPTRFSQADGRL
jgi:hypothetical protein